MAEIVVQKRIAQILFPWTPLLHSRGGDLAKAVMQDLPTVEVRLDRFLFRNDQKCWESQFRSNMAWIAWEAAPDRGAFGTKTDRFFRAVCKALEVPSISRVSYRHMAFVAFDSFEEARRRVHSALLSDAEDTWKRLGGAWPDLAVTLEDAGDTGGRVHVGPVRREEFEGKLEGTFRYPERLTIETAVFIDVDVWDSGTEKWSRSILTGLLERADMLTEGMATLASG